MSATQAPQSPNMKTLTEALDALDGRLGALIDGEWKGGGDGVAVLDKYANAPIAEIRAATADQISEAVRIGANAVAAGSPKPVERAAMLRRAADLMERERPSFLPLLIAEAGFTHREAQAEVDRSQATLRLCAEEALRNEGELVHFEGSTGQESRVGFTQRFPLGVICAITPFNSPLNTVLHKLGPALAAGNSVVLKPAAATPLSAALLCSLLLEAGAPPAQLALLQGPGSRVGDALLAEQAIDFYAFTGSTEVGRRIQGMAGLRRTQMELGSIASTIVCADGDLEKAAAKCSAAGFRKAGQVCTSVQLMLVEAPVFDEMAERMRAAIQNLRCGDPSDPKTQMGPLISQRDAERVEGWIGDAERSGANRLCGGEREGSVVAPTLLTGVTPEMSVMNREVFGPVISLIPFTELSEAVAMANASPYGLAAGLFTRDLTKGLTAARQMRFGGVHVNEASSARSDGMPFGGVKESGFGREGPRYAIAEMSEERLITLNP